jgi:hypothetical protein
MDKVYDSFNRFIIIQQSLSKIMKFKNYEKLLEIYDKGPVLLLNNCDSDGRRIMILRHKVFEDLNVELSDILTLNHLTTATLLDEPETQICGVILIHDFRNVSINYIKVVDLNTLKKVSMTGDVGALRVKQINILGLPAIANSLFELSKTFLSEKLKGRINLCKNVDDLKKVMDVKNLTLEYGGTDNLKDCIKNFRQKVEAQAFIAIKYFASIEVDKEKMRKYEDENNFEGVGSFRKLEVD